jgi:hypothetical protein
MIILVKGLGTITKRFRKFFGNPHKNMSCLRIIILFSKNQTKEPPAILQCSISGEYLKYKFDDWRDAVHYLFWCKYNSFDAGNHAFFDVWRSTYGYEEEEQFVGDRNEFINRPNELTVFTSFHESRLTNRADLSTTSVWTNIQ